MIPFFKLGKYILLKKKLLEERPKWGNDRGSYNTTKSYFW
jgi:hypothetical protein